MEQKRCWHGNQDVLRILNTLPRRILSLQDRHNIAEFIIHELCSKNCFDITKAAYIIDNPDFDCMRGIAGFCRSEDYDGGDIWTSPDGFSSHMNQASFNQKVRNLNRYSGRRRNEQREDVIRGLAEELGMTAYGCCDISMKHDNHGLFLYEGAVDDEKDHDCLLNGISLLSFCPIY